MDAQQFDEARARRRLNLIIAAVLAVMILAWVAYHLRDYPERHAVDKFLAALEQKNTEAAYGILMSDPDWKQHPTKYAKYPYGEFYTDWGPAGEWGIIKSHNVDCSYASGSGVLVQATINERSEHAYLWVDKSDKSLHTSPDVIDCGNWWGWLTE